MMMNNGNIQWSQCSAAFYKNCLNNLAPHITNIYWFWNITTCISLQKAMQLIYLVNVPHSYKMFYEITSVFTSSDQNHIFRSWAWLYNIWQHLFTNTISTPLWLCIMHINSLKWSYALQFSVYLMWILCGLVSVESNSSMKIILLKAFW